MARRQSIYIDSFAHVNPIPAACRVGNIVYSGVITGIEPDSHQIADGLERQCELMFEHIRTTVEAAGGSVDDIVKLSVWMKDSTQRHVLNTYWTALFPDPQSRPARHTDQADLAKGKLIQSEFVAVLAT